MINFEDYITDLDLEYTDFDIPVTCEWCVDYWDYANQTPEQHCGVNSGILYKWIYNHKITDEDYIEYLGKTPDKITAEDLKNINDVDFYNFLLDKYREDAYEDAENKWEDDLDDSWVRWDDPRDYEPDCD